MRDWISSFTKMPRSALELRQSGHQANLLHRAQPLPAIGELALRLGALRTELRRAAPSGDKTVAATIRALARIERLLLKPYRIAIMGEFNTGKSSLANLLIGNAMLPTRAVSNTRVPTLIRHSDEPQVLAVYEDGRTIPLGEDDKPELDAIIRFDVGLPVERLRVIEIADLPGISDPWLQEQKLDIASLGIDAVLWCTLATQAWKESERMAFVNVPAPVRQHGLLVVTNKDLLKGEGQEAKVLGRLTHLAGGLFRNIILLSTPQTLTALDQPQPERTARLRVCGMEALESSFDAMLRSLAERRLEAIIGATQRTAQRALQRI
jgi:hypothetical protein